ncbi:MAG: hypothetical protein ABI852_08505 [Gemmatimonadaceae bacterium]
MSTNLPHVQNGLSANTRRQNTHKVALRTSALLLSLTVGGVLAACATGGGTTATPNTQPSTTTPSPAPAAQVRWAVKRAEHVDLWLHSFAEISNDTAAIPLFKRHYRDSITAGKTRRNILSSLDANRSTLASRIASNPGLINAQFVALQFGSFAELQKAIESFLQFQGDASKAPDRNTGVVISQLAQSFPTAADREWLRLFLAGVLDEKSRFYDAEYVRSSNARAATLAAVDSLWQKVYRPKFDRFLNNTSQRNGEMLLSLPLGGEGRTGVGPTGQPMVAVPFPERRADAVQSIFVLAHEVTGNLVGTVVSDNTTPAQQRDGMAGTYISFGQVLGGLMLLQKIAPELAEPYARYYLAQGGKAVPATNAVAALKVAFPVPPAISDALAKQIEIVLAGI